MEPDVAHDEPPERRDARPRPEPFSREALARELNAAQLDAVVYPAGPLLVVAGAGSGKTRVITYRLARLVATGADPRRILAVTFTNKAAGELRERVRDLLRERIGVGLAGLAVGTFHSMSARLRRQYGEAVTTFLRGYVLDLGTTGGLFDVVSLRATEKLLTPPHADRASVWALATAACLVSGDYRKARESTHQLPVT